MKTYEVKARDVVEYTAYVEADDEEEALKKFKEGEWCGELEHDRFWHDGGEKAVEADR